VPLPPEHLSTRKGERNSRIVLNTRIGRGIVGVDVPVLVKDISFEADMKIQLQTMNGFPFIKMVSLQFPEHPHIDFNLKPLKGLFQISWEFLDFISRSDGFDGSTWFIILSTKLGS
jgi:Ca2+-dependent lipid-binding protein